MTSDISMAEAESTTTTHNIYELNNSNTTSSMKMGGLGLQFGPSGIVAQIENGIIIAIVVIGFASNTLSFLTVTMRSLIKSSVGVYLVALAIFDNISLVFTILSSYSVFLFNIKLETQNDHVCRLISYLSFTPTAISNNIIAALSCERCFVISRPYSKTPGRKQALLIVTAIVLILFLWDIKLPITKQIVELPSMFNPGKVFIRCGTLKKYMKILRSDYMRWLGFTLYTGLPGFLVVTTNLIIIIKLMSHSQDKYMTGQDNKRIEQIRLTYMLLSISIFFILCTLAPHLYMEFSTTFSDDAWRVIKYLYVLSFSCNFFLYLLAGKRFREEALGLVKSWCFCYGNRNKKDDTTSNQSMPNISIISKSDST